MRRWVGFLDICDLLTWRFLGGLPSLERVESWSKVVEMSNLFLVSPAVAWCVDDQPKVPTEIGAYYREIRALSARRESAMLDALEVAVDALNKSDIEPILLKGMAHLVEKLYPAGTRLAGDADLLIAPAEADRAFDALVKIGYEVSSDRIPEQHRHLPALLDPTSGLAIELHTRLEQKQHEPVFSLHWLRAGAEPATFRRTRVRRLKPTQLVAQNFAHHRINDVSRPSPVELRWLLDLALMRRHYSDQIDWDELSVICSKAGHAGTFSTYLTFAERLFGQPLPLAERNADPHAMRKLREYVEPSLRPLSRDDEIVSRQFSGHEAHHVAGHCWKFLLPPELLPGDRLTTRTSTLDLYQGDTQLGPAFSDPKIVESIGRGSYWHHDHELHFSTFDNLPPSAASAPFIVKATARASAAGRSTTSSSPHAEEPNVLDVNEAQLYLAARSSYAEVSPPDPNRKLDLDRELKLRSHRISYLYAVLARSKAQLLAKEQEARALEQRLLATSRDVLDLERQLLAKDRHALELLEAVRSAQNEVEVMRFERNLLFRSKSWRITAPLRWLKRFLSRGESGSWQ